MSIRAEQKRKTRQAIVDAAMELSESKGFSGLALREVTRAAGIAPATFYRHFDDMDALGLALVDEVAKVLRELLKNTRYKVKTTGSTVRSSVESFFECLEDSPHLFRLLSSDRAGGPKRFQQALRQAKQGFIDELVDDLGKNEARQQHPLAYIPELADMIVNQVFYGGLEALEANEDERKAIAEKLITQTRLALQGSKALWVKNHVSEAVRTDSAD